MSTPTTDPRLTVGPILVGSLASFMFFGGYFIQAFSYTQDALNAPHQQKRFHILVAFVTLLEIANVSMIFHSVWHAFIMAFRDPALATVPASSGPALQMMNGVVACTVQAFFGWRIWVLSSKKIEKGLSVMITLLAVSGLALAIAVATQFIYLISGRVPTANVNVLAGLQLSFHLVCDAMITLSMIMVFAGYKERIAITETKNLLNALTMNTLENGLATTVVASLNLAFFLARPGDMIHAAFHYLIGRLYANVLLASLNNRRRMGSSLSRNTHATSSHSISINHPSPTTRFGIGMTTLGPSNHSKRASGIVSGGSVHDQDKSNPDVLISVSKEVYIRDQ
ncbi:hypothetical protein CC2G_011198 [Coprinopsis cinerea AmutBmut pab1-1]|nr:hypothetical protein CC2G_011198 [Coprinopsis cinerea AmutBmut pab1-1]KAG2014375.1 hypothetical protein CC2G_011198 [Coprinopsis cinerea AmutBmut pab1-1]